MPVTDSITIKIDDSDKRDLTISAESKSLGSQYDNFAKKLVFEAPRGWEGDALVLFFRDSKSVYEPLDIGLGRVFPVPDGLTGDTRLTMQIAFRHDGALTHSDQLEFTLRPSMPSGQAPSAPWPRPVDELIAGAFVSVKYEGDTLSFFNSAGDRVGSVTVTGGAARNVTVSESEPESPEEGTLWGQIKRGSAGDLTLGSLALGIQVRTDFSYLGEPIVFEVAAKSYAGYPSGSVTLLVKSPVVSRAFDAAEPQNTGLRTTNGNNRYMHSNLRQWLNSEAGQGQWYSPQHSMDAPPILANMYNGRCPYADEAGFLSYFPEDFRGLLMPTEIKAATSSTDGSVTDTMTDRVWLVSRAELTAWGYTTAARLIKYCTKGLVADFVGAGKLPVFGNPCAWYLRDPNSDSNGVMIYNSTGALTYSFASSSEGIAFAVNLPAETAVELADGAYVIRAAGRPYGRTRAFWDGEWVSMDGSERIDRLEERAEASEGLAGRYAGRSINFLGDSITEALALTKPYTKWMAELLGAGVIRNYGSDGSTIARRAGKTNSMVERYSSMANADMVCVLGGVNDCWSGVPLGELGGGDDFTFAGAAETLVKGLVGKYPAGRVLVFAPGQATVPNSALLPDYVETLRRVCAKYSVPFLDTYSTLGICPAVAAQKTALIPDGVHPNEAGHEKMGRMFAAFALSV